MTEHEKLKKIWDKIGYKNNGIFWDNNKKIFIKTIFNECNHLTGLLDVEVDPREIIFTAEFKKKYIDWLKPRRKVFGYAGYTREIYNRVLSNLENPVEYLYNILFPK